MDLNTITVTDFKNQFIRDFPYLPIWIDPALDPNVIYDIGDEVYYDVNSRFYRCLVDDTQEIPTVATDWERYSDKIENYVLDSDITKAFLEAQAVFNQALFSSDDFIKQAYLYLTANYLVIDIQNALQGLSNKGLNIVASRSAGSVSESYAIPESYQSNPIINQYTKTGYGQKYLSLVLPFIIGNVSSAEGGTIP